MMTTMKNKIMKSATSSYKKVVCILLAVSMVLSLTACKNGNDNKESNTTTESTTISPVPTQHDETKPIESSVAPTEEPSVTPSETPTAEPTQEPTSEPTQKPDDRMYTYKIYDQFEVTMGINIDDYILVTEWGKVFMLHQLAWDCGWEATSDGISPIDKDSPEAAETAVIRLDNGVSPCFAITGDASFCLVYRNRDNSVYPNEEGCAEYANLSFENGSHTDEYMIKKLKKFLSYDDVILIAYVLWSDSVNPGINPVWSVFGDWNCTRHAGEISYRLP